MEYWYYLLLMSLLEYQRIYYGAIQGWHKLCVILNINIRGKGNYTHDLY